MNDGHNDSNSTIFLCMFSKKKTKQKTYFVICVQSTNYFKMQHEITIYRISYENGSSFPSSPIQTHCNAPQQYKTVESHITIVSKLHNTLVSLLRRCSTETKEVLQLKCALYTSYCKSIHPRLEIKDSICKMYCNSEAKYKPL